MKVQKEMLNRKWTVFGYVFISETFGFKRNFPHKKLPLNIVINAFNILKKIAIVCDTKKFATVIIG